MGRLENLKSWKPGQSGNPKGRPYGARSFKKILAEMLDKSLDVSDPHNAGRNIRVTTKEALSLKLIEKGIRGELNAIKEIRDMVDGPIAQKVEIEDSKEALPLSIRAKTLDERLRKLGMNEKHPKHKNKKTG